MNYSNLSSRIKNKLSALYIESGLNTLQKKSGSKIVMYHGIDLTGSKKFNARFIGIKDFENQIIYFKKHFNVVSLSDYHQGNYNKKLFTIAITFDDGYLNNLKYALPILEKHKVPASFFITGLNTINENIIWSDFVDIASSFLKGDIKIDGMDFYKKVNGRLYRKEDDLALYDLIKNDSKAGYEFKKEIQKSFLLKIKDFRNDPSLFDYWKIMSDVEIQQFSKSKFVTVGSHGYFHNNLKSIGHYEAMKEISESKTYLEHLTQKEINSIAFPDGSYTRKIIDDTAKLGINLQLAVSYLYDEDLADSRVYNRYGIYPFYSANKLGYILKNNIK